jgi:hypothetical protein
LRLFRARNNRNHSVRLIIPSSVEVKGGWRANPEAFLVLNSE